jgi:16S rRNA (cytosine1402-N4)-methyltransferase
MHKPVLLNEVLSIAKEIAPRTILDGTFGRGGHSRALLEAIPEARLTGFDQDLAAIEHARREFSDLSSQGRFHIYHFNFHDIAKFKEGPPEGFDVILLDLGVSSPQLDTPERGFSFYHDGPLDMRMNQAQEKSAADVVNTWSEVELNELFSEYGEIRRPQRVVRALVNDRREKPFQTTRELASLIERVEGWSKKGHHPATRYFLALRMAVNDELAGLEACVPDLLRALSPKGRLVIITFHSLEDRIIKYAFRERREFGRPLFKKVIVPSREEERDNPRARSAKLRIFQRGNDSNDQSPEESE